MSVKVVFNDGKEKIFHDSYRVTVRAIYTVSFCSIIDSDGVKHTYYGERIKEVIEND